MSQWVEPTQPSLSVAILAIASGGLGLLARGGSRAPAAANEALKVPGTFRCLQVPFRCDRPVLIRHLVEGQDRRGSRASHLRFHAYASGADPLEALGVPRALRAQRLARHASAHSGIRRAVRGAGTYAPIARVHSRRRLHRWTHRLAGRQHGNSETRQENDRQPHIHSSVPPGRITTCRPADDTSPPLSPSSELPTRMFKRGPQPVSGASRPFPRPPRSRPPRSTEARKKHEGRVPFREPGPCAAEAAQPSAAASTPSRRRGAPSTPRPACAGTRGSRPRPRAAAPSSTAPPSGQGC